MAQSQPAVPATPAEPLGPRFAHLVGATGLSNLADGLLQVGVPLLALTLTRSPQEVAFLSTALTLPWLLLSVHAGLVVDRYDRARVLAVATTARVLVLAAGAAAAATGALTLPMLMVLLAVLGSAEVFADSSASALVPGIVPRPRLHAANGRVLGMQQLAQAFLGGPLAGVVLALGAGWLFGVPAALCALALVLVLRGLWGRVPRPVGADTPRRSARTELGEGVRFLLGHRVVRPVVLTSTVLNFAATGYFAVLVLWVVGPGSAVGLTPVLWGLLSAAMAVGALTGALVTERLLRHVREARLIGGSWFVQAALLLVPVLVPHVGALVVMAVLMGLTNMVGNVVGQSLRQRLVPDDLLGRVGGVARMLGFGAMPLGAATAGVLAERLGLAPVLVGASLLGLLAVGWWVRVVPQRRIDEADQEALRRSPSRRSGAQV